MIVHMMDVMMAYLTVHLTVVLQGQIRAMHHIVMVDMTVYMMVCMMDVSLGLCGVLK